MSQTQEIEQARNELNRRLATLNQRAAELRVAVRTNLAELLKVEREAGEVQGVLTTNGPIGFGGFPAYDFEQYQAAEKRRLAGGR